GRATLGAHRQAGRAWPSRYWRMALSTSAWQDENLILMTGSETVSTPEESPRESGWRERAVARSLDAARTRAEERVQRILDAAFELIDENGSTDFTIQEVVERSKQSLRGFYEYFDGKDELVLALFEE